MHLKERLEAAIMRGGGPLDTTIRRLGWGKSGTGPVNIR